jgi:hypothetical protein
MHCVPPLLSPVAYADKSLKNNTIYDSPKETYTLTNEAENLVFSQGLLAPIMDCYSPSCIRGSNSCYAPKCPNNGSGTTQQFLAKSNIIINVRTF